MVRHLSAWIFLVALLLPSRSYGCPLVKNLPDFNCDGELHVVVMGDSLVSGYGDTDNNNVGGYVLRAQRALPGVTFHNLGIQGLTSVKLLLNLTKAFDSRGKDAWFKALRKADLVVLDIGRNDRWFFGEAQQTARRIRKAVDMIRYQVARINGSGPLVVTSILMLPNRGAQAPWVVELNRFLRDGNTPNKPADLYFDQVSKRLLSPDRIHPTPEGYQVMAGYLLAYIRNTYPVHVAVLRPDKDRDRLYDLFEILKFHSDPKNRDTDGDGVIDGKDPDTFTGKT